MKKIFLILMLSLPTLTWGNEPSKQSQGKAGQPQSYATWSAAEFEGTGTSPVRTTMDADPDGDGMSNLFEYAIGGDPLYPDADAQPTARLDGKGGLVFVFNRDASKSDLIYAVETSSDMSNWRRVPSEIVRSKGTTETRSVTLPVSSRLGFVRLTVSVVAD